MGLIHEDIIVDADVKCVIDIESKKIECSSPKNALLQYDHNSERIGFTMPRYVDGHDMSLVDRIVIKYLNVRRNDMYIVDDLSVTEDGENITFTWLVSGNATQEVGSLVFLVNFRCYDDEGRITYNWSTKPCSTFSIMEGVTSMDSNPLELYDFWARYGEKVDTVTATTEQLEQQIVKMEEDASKLDEDLSKLDSYSSALEERVDELQYSVPVLDGKAVDLMRRTDEIEAKVDTLDRTLVEDQAYEINKEIEELFKAIGMVVIERTSINLLDMNSEDCVMGKFMATNGVFTDHDTYFVSQFIPVKTGQTIAATFNDSTEDTLLRFVTAYNYNKEVITDKGANSVDEYLVPDGVYFIRISILLRDDFYNYMVYLKTSSERPSYEEYYEPYYELVDNTDDTLTLEGVAADAKVVGQELHKIRSRMQTANPTKTVKTDSLLSGETLSLDDFPEMLKHGQRFSVSARLSEFGETDNIKIGFINPSYGTYQGYLEITATNTIWHLADVKEVINEPHNLNIKEYLNVVVTISADTAQVGIVINTLDGMFTFSQTSDSTRCNAIGTLSLIGSMDLTNVTLNGTCTQFKCDTWLIGDSYFGAGGSRVTGRLIEWGFADGVLIAGLGGLNSKLGYSELQKLLNFGAPKRLVWYLGMNDSASIVEEYYPMLESLCEANEIELIFNRIPVVPSRIAENTAVNNYVMGSGKRYIDSYEAIGSNDSGEWFAGYLSDDGVHPSDTGAAALTSRMLVDVPEILSK